MKIYIAGPITKYLNNGANIEAFRAAAELIEEQGHEAIIPHSLVEHLDLDPINNYEHIMSICFSEITRCHRVAMLPNWRESKGATRELEFATQIGTPVAEIHETLKILRTLKAA